MSVKLECRGKVNGVQECAGCGKKIHDKHVLKVSLTFFRILFENKFGRKKMKLNFRPEHTF